MSRFLRLGLLIVTTALLTLSANAQEQLNGPRFEITARMGAGGLKRFGDNYSDGGMTLGAGTVIRLHRRLGFEFVADRFTNLEPSAVLCGLASCSGSAVEGVRSASHISSNILYHLPGTSSVSPFVLGGIGMLQTRSANAVTYAGMNTARIVQQPDEIDRGVSLGFGGGLRIPIGGRLSLRPEIRVFDSTVKSRNNLSMFQTALVVGYRW